MASLQIDETINRLVNCVIHFRFEPFMYLLEIPLLVFEILHPLEVADDNAARVRENVGQYDNTFSLQDFVSSSRQRSIRILNNQFRFDVVGVVGSDLALERRRDQDIAVVGQDFLVAD